MSAFEGRNDPQESELEACIDYAANVVNVDMARAELSKLRADLAAAQRERDEALARVAELQASRAELMATLAAYGEVEQPNGEPLTPRRCVTCAQEAAREMRDNAENICRDWNRAPYLVGSHFGGDSIPFAMRFHLADAIAALPLPSCDGCNPLEPEAENEATR